VDRTACIDLPAFPLQLALRRHPDWCCEPAAVVETDKPQAPILWVNERAYARGVRVGMRYAAGLSLASGLRAEVVPEGEIRDEVALLAERLQTFTPNVEPATGDPGVFWLDARGLDRLFPSLDDWARKIRDAVTEAGLRAAVVVGFSRFGSYALARGRRGVLVLRDVAQERDAARAVPLDRLRMPPVAREALAKLGVATVGRFADLPADGVGTRFGSDVLRLHRLASGDLVVPLRPHRPDHPAVRRVILDDPEEGVAAILAIVAREIEPLLDEVGGKGHALQQLELGFRFERLGEHVEPIVPASPTLSPKLVMELVRLRLEALRKLPDRVVEILVMARETAATERQRQLFADRKRRDLDAANRALARVRARLGGDAVVHARPANGHLPEARFAWAPFEAVVEARPAGAGEPRLVRRIHVDPLPLPPRERHEPDGWMLRGLEQGPVVRVQGPYLVSGGWWNRPVHRSYHFAETKDGEVLWVYFDRAQRRWFLQGRVE